MKAFSKLTLLTILLFAPVYVYADEHDGTKPEFVYDADIEMNFDNREFYKSSFSNSMTIFGARLTPSVGFKVKQNEDTEHRVMIGVDVMKDFGSAMMSQDYFGEISLYYELKKKLGQTELTLNAGIFPRKMMLDNYSPAFFSDSLKFYDNNLEGLLLKFERPNASFDLGCDWSGKFGDNVRERFLIFSSGEGCVVPMVHLGYAAYVYHFASSNQVTGVVDNILVNPWVRLDLSSISGLQALSFRLGWLQAMQNDRRHIGIYTYPHGGEFNLEVKNWNIGIRNSMYYGKDLMPYYNRYDAGDIKYGNQLYMGDPFYRVNDRGDTSRYGMYDRLEIFWQPYICNFMDIRIGAFLHFNEFRYSGFQQVVKVQFNLSKIFGHE